MHTSQPGSRFIPGLSSIGPPSYPMSKSSRTSSPMSRSPSAEPKDDGQGEPDDYPDIDSIMENASRSASPASRPPMVKPDDGSYKRIDDYPEIDSMLDSEDAELVLNLSESLDNEQPPNAYATLREQSVARSQVATTARQFLVPKSTMPTSGPFASTSSVRSTASSIRPIVRTVASTIRKGAAGSSVPSKVVVSSRSTAQPSAVSSLRPSLSTSTNNESSTAPGTTKAVIVRPPRKISAAVQPSILHKVSRRGGPEIPARGVRSGAGTGAGVEVKLEARINTQKPQKAVVAIEFESVSSTLQEATQKSTVVWHQDLKALFHHAKDRFPDVVWKVDAGEDGGDGPELWGHQAIIYTRAPPSFQSQYFSLTPAPGASSPLSTTTTLSLDIARSASRSASPSSTAPSAELNPSKAPLRLSISINTTLFESELEYLYTGQGFGQAFEFLFDSSESSDNEAKAEELRTEKLRKDLLYMWRSRLHSDIRIALKDIFRASSNESMTAVFSAHRFILVSRSPYFQTALVELPNKRNQHNEEGQVILELPSPPFTPAALHFTLGYIYTGTLMFSHRTYDLDTAFHVMRAASYLTLPSLYDEIQARIVREMMHGLFHAFLPFSEYEQLTSGAWGTDASGCRCRRCVRRAPRVLQFSQADDVKNKILERGARRALVGMFGEGWCTSDFAALPLKVRDSLLNGVKKRMIAKNVFVLLFAAERALDRLAAVTEAWTDEVKETMFSARKAVDDAVCRQFEACFGGTEWGEIMKRDGGTSEDAAAVKLILASINRGMNERDAVSLYQTLASILRRQNPTEKNAPDVSPMSNIRVQVEQARVDLLEWIGKHWITVRQVGSFNKLEGWVLMEICDHIELPPEDLLNAHFAIVARLTAVFKNVQQYRRLLSYRDSEAQRILDIFQMLLDTNGLSAEFRRNLLVATQRLSKRSGVYPTCYNLKDVELTSEHPVAAGSFADIYRGRLLGQTVCLKVIRLYQTSHVASFLQKIAAEAILWGQLSHPNLLPIYGLYQYTTRMCLVSPWMKHGDVTNFLRQSPDADRLLLGTDVASGIDYLHKNDIVHGDLKGANILVDDSGRARLADFGLSAVSDAEILHWTSNSSAASKGGSVRWQAPELFDIESDDTIHNSKPSDVYAFACVSYEIFTGNIPFFEIPRDPAVISKVQAGARPSRPPASSLAWGPWGLTEPNWTLMETCWSTNPADRPTIQDVVVHFALDQSLDNRPIGNVSMISRAQFKDSVIAGSELPSVNDLEALLDSISISDSDGHNSIS